MRAIFTFLVLTVACLGLTVGLIAIASYSNSLRPKPTPAADRRSPELPAAAPVPEMPVAGSMPIRMRTTVFRTPAAPTPDEETAFRAVFDSLRQALADKDEAALASLFDVDRLAQELEQFGVFANIPSGNTPAGRADFVRGMREGLTKSFISNELLRWERTQVRWVQHSADGREAIVTAHHRSALLGNRAYKLRWWLIRGPEDWYVYDLEELEMGMRLSRVAASTFPPFARDIRGNSARLPLALAGIHQAMAAMLRGNVEEADEKLQEARGIPLPPPLAAVLELIEGMILFG